jgi:hypothetical protein
VASYPDPNSPYADSQLQSMFGVHAPGTPTSAGKPGPQAADVTFPAPPGVAAAPPGRPTAPPTPAPVAPVPQAATPQAARPAPPAQAPQPQAGAAAGPSTAAPAPASASAALPALTPGGVPGVAGPLGVTSYDASTGGEQLALSPEGAQRYREAVVQARTALGPVPKIFRHPSLPEMPVELGRYNYNPFTGQFTK